MKLVINYDFFNAIKDTDGKISPMKLIRNEKYKYLIASPIWYAVARMAGVDLKMTFGLIAIGYCWILVSDTLILELTKRVCGDKADAYTTDANKKLTKLISELYDINVKTTYEKLLKSELYYKEYQLDRYENGFPKIVSKKYYNVPSYGYDNKEQITSLLEEHALGSDEYILSADEPDKKYRRVLAKSNI